MIKHKILKISHPAGWEDSYSGHWNYYNLTPGNKGFWKNYKIELNNSNCRECDYWIIHEGIDNPESVTCASENVIFIPGEERTQVLEYPQKYLDQFGTIITSRDDLTHPVQIRDQYLCSWQVKKTYDDLIGQKEYLKSNDLSAVISNSTWLEGHKKRFAFTNKLKGHFKDRLDWFCKGENYIEDKWDGLAKYKYSICIENSSHLHYFTEKIMDSFLAGALPFYWGCPNISEYFPPESLIQIDVDNFKKSINLIEQAIENKAYDDRLEHVLLAKELVLNKYQIIPGIVRLLEANQEVFHGRKRRINIRSKASFTKKSMISKLISKLRQV